MSAKFKFGLALLLLLLGACRGDQERQLNLYIWSAYLAPDTLPRFEQRYGVRVVYDYYESNEALLAKLKAGGSRYDVIVPSDYMVEILIREGLLEPLDRQKLTNLANIDPRFLGLHYDPENRYSVPYMWGTTAIGYRKDKVGTAIESWGALWDARYANRIAMLDDMRENFAAALAYLGYSINTTDPRQLAEARDLLIKQKPLVKAYVGSGLPEILLSGDVWLAQAFSGQVARAALENPNLGYVVPREGATIAVDNLCIARGAPHKELAHKFIDYILEPETAAAICRATRYSTPNRAAYALLEPELLADKIIFPPPEDLARCEFIRDVGPAVAIYDSYWTEIKSR